MSDQEWAFHERFILAVHAPNGRKPLNHRLGPDGLFRIARTGAPWRDLPEKFGKWFAGSGTSSRGASTNRKTLGASHLDLTRRLKASRASLTSGRSAYGSAICRNDLSMAVGTDAGFADLPPVGLDKHPKLGAHVAGVAEQETGIGNGSLADLAVALNLPRTGKLPCQSVGPVAMGAAEGALDPRLCRIGHFPDRALGDPCARAGQGETGEWLQGHG